MNEKTQTIGSAPEKQLPDLPEILVRWKDTDGKTKTEVTADTVEVKVKQDKEDTASLPL